MHKRKLIPVCQPLYLGNEQKYISDAVRSRWISSSGGYIKRFEERFSRYCGARYGIATTSGTSALHLALLALGVGPEDEIIIPNFTMVAVLFAVLYCKAKPVFVDVELDTFNIDAKKIEDKISSRTKAIIVVHTYGHPAEMKPVIELAKKYHIRIVEDSAEAHGAEYMGRKCGSLGHISCFSFYANKIITTGEGGMVVTSDYRLAQKCRYYKNICFSLHGRRDYVHRDLGYNYRMTNIQAALGLAQLENIEKFIERRRANARQYTKLLQDISGIQLPAEKGYAKNVYWMYGVVINPRKFGKTRNELACRLNENGIETRNFFMSLNRQPVLKKLGIVARGQYPVSDFLAENGLYLPSGSGLKREDIRYICETVKRMSKIS